MTNYKLILFWKLNFVYLDSHNTLTIFEAFWVVSTKLFQMFHLEVYTPST